MAFMQIAVGAIGIGILLVIAYVVIANARGAMPAETATNGVANVTAALDGAQATVFAGFGLLAVGVIVMGAFGIITLWK